MNCSFFFAKDSLGYCPVILGMISMQETIQFQGIQEERFDICFYKPLLPDKGNFLKELS